MALGYGFLAPFLLLLYGGGGGSGPILGLLLLCFQPGGQFHEPFGCPGLAVEDDILYHLQFILGDVAVGHLGIGIDDAEVHTLVDGMV